MASGYRQQHFLDVASPLTGPGEPGIWEEKMDRKRRGLVAGGGVATLVVPVTLLGGSAGAAARMPARPDAHISRSVRPDVGVAKETQEFQKTTAGFCPSGGTACDGAE